jgi:hypothetical protein
MDLVNEVSLEYLMAAPKLSANGSPPVEKEGKTLK